MRREELSLKAFLAGEQEAGQGSPRQPSSSAPKFGHPERIRRGSERVPGDPDEAWDVEGLSGRREARVPATCVGEHCRTAVGPLRLLSQTQFHDAGGLKILFTSFQKLRNSS